MSTLNGLLSEYAHKLCYTTSFEEAFSIFEQQMNQLGFEHVLYTFVPRLSLENSILHLPRFRVSENYNDFLEHYLEGQWHQHDYKLKQIQQGFTKILDWNADTKNKRLNPKEKELIDIAYYDYQLRNGITIPTLVGAKGIAVASLISHENNHSFLILKHHTYDIALTSVILFHNHVMSNSFEFSFFIKPLFSCLNQTERKVINCLTKGLSVPYIAKDIGKSIRYTDNVIRSLRIKMGGLTEDNTPRISTKLLIYYIGLMNIGKR